MGKEIKSFSVDEDVAEILSERNELNASAVVNKFLREYVAEGRGEEAALEVRLNELDDEVAELEKALEQKRRERNRIEEKLEERRTELRDQLRKAEGKARNSPQFYDGDPNSHAGQATPNVNADNEMVVKHATRAGITAQRFADELEARL